MGFAPPPHSGFAFLAAPERQRLWTIVLTWSLQSIGQMAIYLEGGWLVFYMPGGYF
jgi:hypothetical protein